MGIIKWPTLLQIMDGQCVDSTVADVKAAQGRTHVLTQRLRHFVHRLNDAVIATQLPPKFEFVVHCRVSPIQVRLLLNFAF